KNKLVKNNLHLKANKQKRRSRYSQKLIKHSDSMKKQIKQAISSKPARRCKNSNNCCRNGGQAKRKQMNKHNEKRDIPRIGISLLLLCRAIFSSTDSAH